LSQLEPAASCLPQHSMAPCWNCCKVLSLLIATSCYLEGPH